MKKTYTPPSKMTPEMRQELDALAALPDDQIDTSDIPELSDAQRATGRRGWPRRTPIELMIDSFLIEWLGGLPEEGDVSDKINRILWKEFAAARDGGTRP